MPNQRHVEHDQAGNAQHPPDPRDLLACARKLHALTAQVAGFVDEQMQRAAVALEAAAEQQDRSTAAAADVDGLDERRAAWDERRRREAQQIRDEQQQLMRAWQRLESEQRRLLLQESAQPQEVSIPVPEPLLAAAALPEQVNGQHHHEPLSANSAPAANREHSLAQVRQLRREIRRHAGRRERR